MTPAEKDLCILLCTCIYYCWGHFTTENYGEDSYRCYLQKSLNVMLSSEIVVGWVETLPLVNWMREKRDREEWINGVI